MSDSLPPMLLRVDGKPGPAKPNGRLSLDQSLTFIEAS